MYAHLSRRCALASAAHPRKRTSGARNGSCLDVQWSHTTCRVGRGTHLRLMKSRTAAEPSTPAAGSKPDAPSRTGLDEEAIAVALSDHLQYQQAIPASHASRHDWYMALAFTVRDRVLDALPDDARTPCWSRRPRSWRYLSAEFLTGPQLGNNLINLGIWDAAARALARFGQDLGDVLEVEEEPGLGNGGLGRLAACYMDSLATLGVPAIGYGIRYEFGIFDQAIRDGWQVEMTDKWLRLGQPLGDPAARAPRVRRGVLRTHRARPRRAAAGTACAGFPPRASRGSPTTRRSRASARPRPTSCGSGRPRPPSPSTSRPSTSATTTRAVDQKVQSETITKVLYPNDEPEAGKQLRLAQQYFFVSCSLQDMIRLHLVRGAAARGVLLALGRAVERHTPRDRRGRADATARGRARHGLGRGLGDHRAHLRVHEPHAAGGSARAVAGGALRHAAAAASGDRPGDQPAVPRATCGGASPGDEGLVQRLSLIDESGERPRADGAPGQRGQPCHQRGGGSCTANC